MHLTDGQRQVSGTSRAARDLGHPRTAPEVFGFIVESPFRAELLMVGLGMSTAVLGEQEEPGLGAWARGAVLAPCRVQAGS